MTTDSIIKDILSADSNKSNKALTSIYGKCFPLVRGYILKNGGSLEDAEDLFQDAIAAVYYNISQNKFREDSPLQFYVLSIAKNQWISTLRKKSIPTTDLDNQQPVNEERSEKVNLDLISKVLHLLKESCQSILISFYFESRTMEEIAADFQLGSAQAAKNKKSRCMKKLGEIIKAYDLKKDHFIL